MLLPETNCATGTLAPYTPSQAKPWDKRRVMHLYRRLGFGATPAEIDAALAKSPAALVDELLNAAQAAPLPTEPEWAYWNINKYNDFGQESIDQIIPWIVQWVKDMVGGGIKEKLALFWHNHFVTRFEAYLCPSHLYQYHVLLEKNVLGNFKSFLLEMGKSPAMLVFLNGVQNTRQQPNENYARELYELFTLGRDNGYTQNDIKETARALTGWNGYFTFCDSIQYISLLHDPGAKTIFGKTGAWNYEQVHDLLFEERGPLIARYISSKIYRSFGHPVLKDEIVEGLAQTFLANNFDLRPVFRQFFQSEHFFDEDVISAQVMGPFERYLTFIREGGFSYNDEVLQALTFQAYQQGQQLFNPVDVAGWPGNRAWINSNTLTGRWQTLRFYAFFLYQNYPAELSGLAKRLAGASTTDPALVTEKIVDHFIPGGLQTAEEYARATAAFKYEIPQNYFDENQWNLDWDTVPAQVALLLDHLVRLPEFQLG